MVRATTKNLRKALPSAKRKTPSQALAGMTLADDAWLGTADAAALVGLSQKTMRQMRCDRAGPRCFKRGESQQARTYYLRSDLERWCRDQLRVVAGGRQS
jgi:hypothetical protein